MIGDMIRSARRTAETLGGVEGDGVEMAVSDMIRLAEQLESCASFVVPTGASKTRPINIPRGQHHDISGALDSETESEGTDSGRAEAGATAATTE